MTDVIDLAARGVFDPRGSTRTLIGLRPDGRTRILMVLTAAFAQLCVVTLANILAPTAGAGATGPQIGVYALGLGITLLTYAMTVALAHRIGARFGGVGSLRDVASAVAWQNILVAVISPLFALGVVGGGALAGAGAAIGVVLSFWYLGAAVAEAHKFRNTLSVVLAIVVILSSIALVVGVLLSMFAGEGV